MALKAQIVLFFLADMIPTKGEEAAATTLGLVRYRNGAIAKKDGKVEKCDAVAGAVPPQYFDNSKFKGKILDVKIVEPEAPVATPPVPPAPPAPPVAPVAPTPPPAAPPGTQPPAPPGAPVATAPATPKK